MSEIHRKTVCWETYRYDLVFFPGTGCVTDHQNLPKKVLLRNFVEGEDFVGAHGLGFLDPTRTVANAVTPH